MSFNTEEMEFKEIKVLETLRAHCRNSTPVAKSKHAAAVVFKGKIIALATNSYKSHPAMLKYGTNEHRIFLHAEVAVLLRVIKKYGSKILKYCKLYVGRFNQKNKAKLSKPCPVCMNMIKAYKVKEVIWTV